jgi:hypothetical protein
MSKNNTVLEYLKTGKMLTTKKAKKKLGIANVGKQIYALRAQGHEIISYNHRSKSTGVATVRYAGVHGK